MTKVNIHEAYLRKTAGTTTLWIALAVSVLFFSFGCGFGSWSHPDTSSTGPPTLSAKYGAR